LNVTFLTSTFPELSEQFIINQVVGLIDAGVEVTVISLHDPVQAMLNPEFDEYDLGGRTQSLSIPRDFKLRLLKAVPKFIRLLFTDFRRLLLALRAGQYNRAVFSLKTIYVLDAFRNTMVPLLHCHFGPNGVVGVFMKDAGIAQSLVTTFHGSDINSYPLRHGREVYTRLFEAADLITVNTTFTGEKAAGYGADWNRIEILPVGLRCRDYPHLKKDFDFTQSPVVLTVARLEEKKGIEYALRAMAAVVREYPRAEYHIVGSGSLGRELKKLTEELGLAGNVTFHGFCNRARIFELYRIASVFILPSVTAASGDMEGQGLVLQEAQAVGLPVISTLHNGIPDGVIDGKSGFLVPERDVEALSDKIKFLTDKPDVAANMGMTGREFVCGKYDIPLLTEKTIQIYEKVMPPTVPRTP